MGDMEENMDTSNLITLCILLSSEQSSLALLFVDMSIAQLPPLSAMQWVATMAFKGVEGLKGASGQCAFVVAIDCVGPGIGTRPVHSCAWACRVEGNQLYNISPMNNSSLLRKFHVEMCGQLLVVCTHRKLLCSECTCNILIFTPSQNGP